jgi:hypothetical protein
MERKETLIMKNSEKNEIVESLFQAIETIARKEMSGLAYDKTVLCKVTDDTYRTKGEYTVSDGTSTFIAYSENTTFVKGTSVYVTIPASDYNNKKLIIGKYTDSDNDKYHTYQEPFDDLLDVTGNIIGRVNENSLSILANGGTGQNQKEKVIWSQEWTDPTSFMEKTYSRMGLRAKFLTKFAGLEVASGHYGLRLDIISKSDDAAKVQNEDKYFSCDFGILDFYGDPYNFEGVPFLQEKVFDISEINQITYMQLVLYQKNDFLNIRKEVVDHTMGKDGNLPDNIIVSDIYLSLGYAMNEFTEDTVLLYTYDPVSYVATSAEKDLLRTIQARWVHFENESDSIPKMIDKVEEIPGIENNIPDYTKVHWYRFNRNESAKDDIAGSFWDEIHPDTRTIAELGALDDDALKALASKYKYELDITIPEREDKLQILTAVKEVLSDASGKTYTKHENLLAQPVKVDKTMAEERYKVIVECPSRLYCTRQMIDEMAKLTADDFKDKDGVVDIKAWEKALLVIKNEWNSAVRFYYSDDFVFENEEMVANAATIDAIRGLKILCDEAGLKGEYCIYGPTCDIMNPTEAKKVRTMVASYESLVTGESSLDKAESITWKIPLTNTMIYEPEHGYEFDNTKDKVEYLGYDNEGKEITAKYKSDIPNPTYVLITRQGTEKYDVGENVEALQIKAEQTFRIRDYYVSSATNNTVTCTVVKNKVTVFATTSMVFGQQGSNGTDSTLLLRWADNRSAIHPGEALKVYAYLYDYENNPIEITEEHGMDWTWWSAGCKTSKNNTDLAISSIKGDKGVNYCTISAKSEANGNNFNGWVLKGTLIYGCAFEEVTDENGNILAEDGSVLKDPETQTPMRKTRDVKLEAYLPIAVCSNNLHFAEIADKIIYDANGGNPSYYKNPLKIFKNEIDCVSSNFDQWSIHYDDNKGAAKRFYPSLAQETKDNIPGIFLKPKNMYYSGNDKAVTICWDGTIDGKAAFWHQSLYIGQNRWPSAMLNSWDGSLTIDEKNGTILSTMVGAGKKNADNTFSGVLMGDILAGAGLQAADNHEGLGIYGFHHGDQSFGFNIEGTAFIGKSGRGRIYFDGSQGTITSGNYIEDKTGMQIDLDGSDGKSSSLFAFGGGGRFYLDTADDAEYLLRITDADNDNTNVNDLFVISTKETADGDGVSSKYYLQSSNFSSGNQTGTRFDLQNGKITSYGAGGYYILDSSNDDILLRIAGIYNNEYKDILTVGSGTYILESLNYDEGQGLHFNLNDGSIQAYNFYLEAGTGDNTLIISSDANDDPLSIGNGNFRVEWDGTTHVNEIHAENGGTIGPFTISTDALTGNGVTLEAETISVGDGFVATGDGDVTLTGLITGTEWNVTSDGVANFHRINADGGNIGGWEISKGAISGAGGGVALTAGGGITGGGGSYFNLDAESGQLTVSDLIVKTSASFIDSCAITVEGTFNITGDTVLDGNVDITGNISADGVPTAGAGGEVKITVDTPWGNVFQGEFWKGTTLTFRNGLLMSTSDITQTPDTSFTDELDKLYVTRKEGDTGDAGALCYLDEVVIDKATFKLGTGNSLATLSTASGSTSIDGDTATYTVPISGYYKKAGTTTKYYQGNGGSVSYVTGSSTRYIYSDGSTGSSSKDAVGSYTTYRFASGNLRGDSTNVDNYKELDTLKAEITVKAQVSSSK